MRGRFPHLFRVAPCSGARLTDCLPLSGDVRAAGWRGALRDQLGSSCVAAHFSTLRVQVRVG